MKKYHDEDIYDSEEDLEDDYGDGETWYVPDFLLFSRANKHLINEFEKKNLTTPDRNDVL